jgi:hypothetical protein
MNMLHGDRSRGSFSAWTIAVGEGAEGVGADVPGAVTSFVATGRAGVAGVAASVDGVADGVAAAAGGEASVASGVAAGGVGAAV